MVPLAGGVSHVTAAACLVRKIDAKRPALLLDESDAAFNGDKEYAEVLRGFLNTGYRRGGRHPVAWAKVDLAPYPYSPKRHTRHKPISMRVLFGFLKRHKKAA